MRADNNTYSTLTTKKLSGSDGVIKQDIDVRDMKSDKILVTEDFSGTQALDIYQKDNYVPAGDNTEGTGLVLASVNGDGVFTAKDREGTLFYTHYDLANKQSDTAGYTTDWYLDKISNLDPGDKPTTSVDTILAANALTTIPGVLKTISFYNAWANCATTETSKMEHGSAPTAVKSAAAEIWF